MYIKELIIYGYGKFEQLSLKLQSFQLIYGENEAGKSTIMSFIHSILFGFPLKQQTELRYEPKLNAKYGGQLVIETSKWGTVRIERVKGKAIGDVTVFLEDGTRGGDELLQEILNGMDKSTYQSIYSFNNHGLQNVHQLKGDELSQFLFSTSVIGTEKIMAVQNMLEKELDKRFKPYGSKPVLNVQLNQVEQTEKKLTEVKKEVAKYEDLLVEFEKVRTEIEAKRNELESLNHELIVKKEWNRMYPLLLDKQEITRRLQALGDVTFPEDGLTQFNQNEAELKRLTERLAPLYEQKKKLEEELKSIQLDEQVLQHAFDIQQMIEDLPTYKQQLDLYKQTETRLIQLDQEIQDKLTQLDYQAKIDDIAHFDLSFAQKDKITTFVNRKIQLLELRADLERRDEEVRHKLNELEKFIDELKAETLSSQVKQAYEKQLEQAEEQKQARKELDWVTTQLSLLQGRNKQSQGKKLFQLGFISCFVLAIGFFIFEMFELGISFLIPAIVFLVLLVTGKSEENGSNLTETLLDRKKALEEKLQTMIQPETIADVKLKLEKHEQLTRQIETEMMRLQSYEQQFDDIVQAFENIERELNTVEQSLLTIGRSYHLPDSMANNHLLACFDLLVTLREKLFEKKQLKEQQQKIAEQLKGKQARLKELAQIIKLPGTAYDEQVIYLKQYLETQKNLEQTKKEYMKELTRLTNQIQAWQKEQQGLQERIAQLFQQANVSTKEEFVRNGKKFAEIQALHQQLAPINKQLKMATIELPTDFDTLPPPIREEEFSEWEQEKQVLQKQITALEKEQAKLEHAIRRMEEGGTYTELVHQFHDAKYEFRENAKEWAMYQTASYVLQKSMEKYKIHHLPQLLRHASKTFSFITDGVYEKIFIDQARDSLYVKRKDGIVFTPEELSQATSEQLYISIRFALVETMNDKQTFPIIIDDGFVHFDKKREKKMMEILNKLAPKTQILFFSCHKHYLSYFQPDSVIFLNEHAKIDV